MTKLEALDDIRKALLELILVRDSVANDDAALGTFQRSLERLVERFYKETHEILAYKHYQAAKGDSDHLLQLVLLAYRYVEDERAGKILH